MDNTRNIPTDQRITYRRSHAVRHMDCNYSGNIDVHLTICAARSTPFLDATVAAVVCENVVTACRLMAYRLYGFCLMPDHLHVLLSPATSGCKIGHWLDRFKSFTTHEYMRLGGNPPLWQRSAYDHICREGETAENVLSYIVENPVRAGLVERWQAWRGTRVFIDV